MNDNQDTAAAIGGEIQSRAAAVLGGEILAKLEAQTMADFRAVQVQELERRLSVEKAEVARLNQVIEDLKVRVDAS